MLTCLSISLPVSLSACLPVCLKYCKIYHCKVQHCKFTIEKLSIAITKYQDNAPILYHFSDWGEWISLEGVKERYRHCMNQTLREKKINEKCIENGKDMF